jgi:hypothetical protein
MDRHRARQCARSAVLVLVPHRHRVPRALHRKGAPMLVGIAVLTILLLGALFLLARPKIIRSPTACGLRSSPAPRGYGDVVPSTHGTRLWR